MISCTNIKQRKRIVAERFFHESKLEIADDLQVRNDAHNKIIPCRFMVQALIVILMQIKGKYLIK